MEVLDIKTFMKNLTILLFITTIMIIGIFTVSGIDLFKTLAITLAITFYHFAMRLFIGFIYQAKFNNNISWKIKWFQVNKKEMDLYRFLNVKSWKKYMPTYDSSCFDVKTKSLEQIVMAMCQAELVHETIIVFSFFPIIVSVWFGAIEVFISTSMVAALIDLIFVILQRYNRPRVIKILQLRTNK